MTFSAGNSVRATKSSRSGRIGRTLETPMRSVASLAYMCISGTLVFGAR